MENKNLSKKELEKLCLKDHIVLQRFDPMTESSFYMPNFEKIGIMIREFDFLVEGASRGKAINEISRIERHLFKHDGNREMQNIALATSYSEVSIYVESKRELISDRSSDNWNYLFTKYFSLEDIYDYFHKSESSSSFFRKHKIFEDLVDLNYNLKLMEYLQSQVQLFLPGEDDSEIPYQINSMELSLLILRNAGFLDTLKDKLKDNYYDKGAKLLTTLLNLQPQVWKSIATILKDIDTKHEDSVTNNPVLKNGLKDVLFHYKIDFRRKL